MLDLHTIPEQFSELACFHEVWGARRGQRLLHNELKLKDPHADADAWLAASTDEERAKVAARAEARHKLVLAELARSIRSVTREEYLERKRQDMNRWRLAHREENKARCAAWRASNRDYVNAYMRNWRKNMTEEQRKAYVAAAVKRKAEARKAYRLDNPLPPRPKKSVEERRAKQREWDRAYQRKMRQSPEFKAMNAKRQRDRYNSMAPEEKAAYLEKVRARTRAARKKKEVADGDVG